VRIILLGIEAQSTNWTTDCYGANSATGPNLRQYRRAPNAGIPRFPPATGYSTSLQQKVGKKRSRGKSSSKACRKTDTSERTALPRGLWPAPPPTAARSLDWKETSKTIFIMTRNTDSIYPPVLPPKLTRDSHGGTKTLGKQMKVGVGIQRIKIVRSSW